MPVALRTLVKTATYIAIGGISAALFMKFKLEDRVRAQPYYKDSMKLLRAHPGAISVLGEPIKDLGFDFGEEMKKFADGKIEGFVVPVKGANERGKLHFWAEHRGEKWQITRAELELDKDSDRRLLLRKE
uniref:Putative cytochrome oxidase complex assembly protein 1 n=1 Tax=Culex tarsalis TaxID=7177 RepID=A0A1Q3FDS1_CULTA